jgi:hypothetical protein
MGFNKRFVPEIDCLKDRLSELGADMFFKIYVTGPDSLIGSTESINYIDKFARGHMMAVDSKNKQN